MKGKLSVRTLLLMVAVALALAMVPIVLGVTCPGASSCYYEDHCPCDASDPPGCVYKACNFQCIAGSSINCDCTDACTTITAACNIEENVYCTYAMCDNGACVGGPEDDCTLEADPDAFCASTEAPNNNCCSDTLCHVCCNDADCPPDSCDSWGANYCYNNDVVQSRDCYNNYCTASKSCATITTTENQTVQDCGVTTCGAWGANYCSASGDVVHNRSCIGRGCSGSACYANPYVQTAVVTDCGGGEDSFCSGASCQNLCSDGIDNDGDGLTDGQDDDCGGCGQCGTDNGCCDVLTGCGINEGDPCGSSSDTICDNPDLCVAGQCDPNYEVAGFDCDATLTCSTPGDDGYNDGGASYCEAGCDGNGNCDLGEDCVERDTNQAGCECALTWMGFTAGITPNCCGDDGAADDFYYIGGNPTTDQTLNCERCNDGVATQDGPLYGNGYLDDPGNVCFFGDITCTLLSSSNGASEACNDACIGDNDGGPCITAPHNPTIPEACYFDDTCSEGSGCALTSSDTLRQNYCDTCSPTGTSAGDYCPAPGTWVDTTCYSGTQSCTGSACDLTITTTGCESPNTACCGGDSIWSGVSCDPVLGAQGTGNDRDDAQALCEMSTGVDCSPLDWSYANETAPFGEYDDTPDGRDILECCGDDPGEYFITTGPRTGCCDDPDNCIDTIGICREGSEDALGLCTDGIDNDCDGLVDEADADCYGDVSGTVWDGDNLDLNYVVSGALVGGKPPGAPDSVMASDTTDSNGDYYISNAFVGSYEFRASADGFQDSVTVITVESGGVVNQDFYLYRELSCDEYCRDANGYCNYNCNGTAYPGGVSCNFVHRDCWGRPEGYVVSYVEAGTRYNHVCCEGPSTTETAPLAKVTANTKNMYDYKRLVKIGGKSLWMHILVWT